jgi:putative hydrolase of the HAD superfamily
MPEVKAVLFDWAGVMAPDTREPQQWMAQQLATLGAAHKEARAHVNSCIAHFMRGTIDDEEFWWNMAQILPEQKLSQPSPPIWESWQGAHARPEMMSLVENIQSLGVRTVVFSNVLPPCKARIEDVDGYRHFNAQVLSCDEQCVKPEKIIYEIALGAANCAPESCVFIDDVSTNLTPARQLGMRVIHAITPAQVTTELLAQIERY